MRPCVVCSHPERNAINRSLIAIGTSIRDVSRRYGIPPASVHRHRVNHLPRALAAAASPPVSVEPAAAASSGPVEPDVRPAEVVRHIPADASLVEFYRGVGRQLDDLDSEAADLFTRAKGDDDRRTALLALRERARLAGERRAHRELLARGQGELADRAMPDVKITINLGAVAAPRPAEIIDITDSVTFEEIQ